MKPPTIADAKTLSYDLRARGVIVLAFDGQTYAGASYGMTRADCDKYGKVLDKLFDELPKVLTEER